MRKSHTEEEIQEKINSLPTEIKTLLYSSELDGIVQKVGSKNQLHIDQMGFLLSEVRQVMLGFVETKDFPANVMETLEVDRMKADAVAQDVDEMLFAKIRDAMKKVYEQNAAAPAVITPPTPAPSNKSVIMPSAAKMPTPQPAATPMPRPATPPMVPPKPNSMPAMQAVPAKQAPPAPDMHSADVALTQKSVQVAPPPPPGQNTVKPEPASPDASRGGPPKPQPYKADPYREPIE